MASEKINRIKYMLRCLLCDNKKFGQSLQSNNKKCVKGTDSCKAEQWAKSKTDTEDANKQILLDLMKDMPLSTLQIAFIYAKNYAEYGEDVTRTWLTTAENASILEKAYQKGYYEGLKRQAEREDE